MSKHNTVTINISGYGGNMLPLVQLGMLLLAMELYDPLFANNYMYPTKYFMLKFILSWHHIHVHIIMQHKNDNQNVCSSVSSIFLSTSNYGYVHLSSCF